MSHSNYEEIQISFSDGDVSRHPTNITKPEPKPEGSYDYFEPLGEDSSKGLLYRQKCAAGVVVDYLPPGSVGRQFMFKTLPAGYALFEHVKDNGSSIRKDTYLFGHPNGGRFRSPAEFIPHVKYLAANSPENADVAKPADKICQCKLCGAGGRSSTPSKASGTPMRTAGPVSRGKSIPVRAAQHEAARQEIAKQERLGERETLGYVFRKGEVVWIWCGKEDVLCSNNMGDASLWAAAVIVDRPSAYTQLLPETPLNTSFDDIVAGNTPWAESLKNCLYTVHLCNSENPEEPGNLISNVPQHFLHPWLARVDDATGEHPSIPRAKKIVQTFNVFDRTGSTPHPSDPTSKTELYNGIFLGAEKIFVGDPVRIFSDLKDPSKGEDVLIVDSIYASKPENATAEFFLSGKIYYQHPTDPAVTPEQFADLHFRMRRVNYATGEMMRWCLRTQSEKKAASTIRAILGRWYEPEAVAHWTRIGAGEDPKLARTKLVRMMENRKQALGWKSINGIELMKDEDRREMRKAILAEKIKDTTASNQATPTPSWNPINASSAKTPIKTSAMAMAVADDLADDEDDEEPAGKRLRMDETA
ncbi:hypothetical protein BZA77DRAFT_169247 [Pyronema omphalodes]|nr:hypothetical protein BZA77DRAFT_169247 [Pyronema omphalodes]